MPPGLAGQPLRYGELHHSLFITQPPIRDRPFAPPTWVLNLSATDPLAPPTWVLDLSVTDPPCPTHLGPGPISDCPCLALPTQSGSISYGPAHQSAGGHQL